MSFELYAMELEELVESVRTDPYPEPEDIAFLQGLWDGEAWASICEKAGRGGHDLMTWWVQGVLAYQRSQTSN